MLTYLNESAVGEISDLLKDVGIKRETIPFYNMSTVRDWKDKMVYESDRQMRFLLNAMFTPLDMTDYEEAFVGWNELPGSLPLARPQWLLPYQDEPHP